MRTNFNLVSSRLHKIYMSGIYIPGYRLFEACQMLLYGTTPGDIISVVYDWHPWGTKEWVWCSLELCNG
jgi:hypothetical protein